MFLFGSRLPETTTFAPNFEGEQRQDQAAKDLWNATRDLQLYRDNANAQNVAMGEAYERRNKAIFEATGVQFDNPMKVDIFRLKPEPGAGGLPESAAASTIADNQAAWQKKADALARERPQFAAIIGADRPIVDDAAAIARGAETGMAKAQAQADKAGVGTARSLGNTLGGGVAGMLRDPLQVATLFIGGGTAAPAKTVAGRVLERVLTEAAVNGGVEAGVQVASSKWKEQAGVEHGLGNSLQQIGLAALFGGGFGGLLQGGSEIFRLTGKAMPKEAFARAAAGNPEPGDLATIADSLGVKLDEESARTADMAGEQAALDADAFGPPPAGIAPGEAEAAAAAAIRQVEEPPDRLPNFDPQDRTDAIDRIVQSEFPVGPQPPRPITLMQFLASRDVGGIADEGGELASMGLSRKFIPGSGPLVRPKGKSLDYAREAAAEAGFFDDIYGDPETAVAQSLPADLLRAIERERDGEAVFSPRLDRGRVFDWMEYEARQRAQDSYRRVIEDVDSAVKHLGIDHEIDDSVLVRAAELVDDQTQPLTALENALDEDYKNFADALGERGEDFIDDTDIPFFENTATVPAAGRTAGTPRGDSAARRRGPDAPDRQQLQSSGSGEGTPDQPGLRRAGDTPEPGSQQAVTDAEAVLTEARGADSEQTPAGEQTLIEGVKPVSTKEKLEAQGAKPLRGGDKALPEGGLFDLDSQKQIDIWDAMPAATTADGTVLHATYDTMRADADRSAHFSDLIASCKD